MTTKQKTRDKMIELYSELGVEMFILLVVFLGVIILNTVIR